MNAKIKIDLTNFFQTLNQDIDLDQIFALSIRHNVSESQVVSFYEEWQVSNFTDQ